MIKIWSAFASNNSSSYRFADVARETAAELATFLLDHLDPRIPDIETSLPVVRRTLRAGNAHERRSDVARL
jgi:hypothetical protein